MEFKGQGILDLADRRTESNPGSWARIVHGDCLERLQDLEPCSIHLVVTDPPYFLDGLDQGWRKGRPTAKKATGSVGGLPVGMKFDPRQGKELQAFMEQVGALMLEVLKPGAFAVVFSQPRLSHRMAVALEDSGFEIRDLYAWRFTRRAQFKAFSVDHFVDRKNLSDHVKEEMKRTLDGRKTAQLRPQFETMILAQKPKEGTLVDNWMSYRTGLIDPKVSLDGKAPATVMTVEKPQRARYNGHLTVKPLQLVDHLIRLFSLPGQVVLDPFLGSGTTAVAALRAGRSCVGIEINKDYVSVANKRLNEVQHDDKT